MEQNGEACEGQSNDIEVAALDAVNEVGGTTLDGVSSGFVSGLAGGDVIGDVLIGEREEMDDGDLGDGLNGLCGDEGDAGDDAMGATGEQAQHARGVSWLFGFAKDLVVDGNGGVGTEDDQRVG